MWDEEKKRLKKEENGEYDFGEEKKLMKKKVEYTFRRRKKRLMKKKNGEYAFRREKKRLIQMKYGEYAFRRKKNQTETRGKWWVQFFGEEKNKNKKTFPGLSGSGDPQKKM